MSNTPTSGARARRIRNALLASALSLGVVGAVGTDFLFNDGHVAHAQPVQAPPAGPADFTAVVEATKPAVVSVQVKTEMQTVANRRMMEGFNDLPSDHPLQEFFRRFGTPPGLDGEGGNGQGEGGNNAEPFRPRQGASQGSGFFVSQDGYVVTNAHVVENGREFTVLMDDGSELPAKLIGSDERTDLALLKVEGDSFSYVKFATEEPKVGQWVIAVGNPFGLGGTVTAGIISAEGRDIGAGPYDNFLQIDAPVNRGNSGGPTFNTAGEVIGVNTAIFSPSGGNVGIAFAIPAATVQEVVSDLRDDGIVTRGWLGVQIQPVTEDIASSLGIDNTDGAIVADAQADGPARDAGISAGDIITAIDGKPVKDPKALSQLIAGLEPGKEIAVTVLREGREREITVTLGDLGDFDQQQANASGGSQQGEPEVEQSALDGLGLTIEPNPNGDGVVVTGVADDSPASERGLTVGDVITSIGGEPVASVTDIEAGVANARERGRDAVLFRVQGENGTRFVGVPFEQG